MIGFMVQCNNLNCKKTILLEEPYVNLPVGWLTLSGIIDLCGKHYDKHFCNIECFKEYQDLMNEIV